MTDHVDETLRLWRSAPFTWGGTVPHVPGRGDCLLSIGDYIAARGGVDVSECFRGTYSTEAGAIAHLEAHGGPVGLVDLTGLPHTDAPARGDVVVIDTGEGVHIGALCTGPGIAARLERGVIEISLRFAVIVQGWKVP